MRVTISTFLLLLLTACAPASEPATTATETKAPVAATPAITPTDEEVTGDPTVDNIRKQQAIVDDLLSTGMLQQKNLPYNCNGLRGTTEVHRKDGVALLVLNRYNDGENRTITDRFYYKDGKIFFQLSQTLRWEFEGSTKADQNGNDVPVIINHVARYRYYIQDGKVVKFLKRKFSFSSTDPEPAEESFPLEDATPAAELSYRTQLAQTAIEKDTVDCTVFQ